VTRRTLRRDSPLIQCLRQHPLRRVETVRIAGCVCSVSRSVSSGPRRSASTERTPEPRRPPRRPSALRQSCRKDRAHAHRLRALAGKESAIALCWTIRTILTHSRRSALEGRQRAASTPPRTLGDAGDTLVLASPRTRKYPHAHLSVVVHVIICVFLIFGRAAAAGQVRRPRRRLRRPGFADGLWPARRGQPAHQAHHMGAVLFMWSPSRSP